MPAAFVIFLMKKSQTMKTTRYSVKNFIPYLKKGTMISAFPLIFPAYIRSMS